MEAQSIIDIRELAYEVYTKYEIGEINFIELIKGLKDLGLNQDQIDLIINYYET